MLKWSQLTPLAGIPPGVEPAQSHISVGVIPFGMRERGAGVRLSSLTERQACLRVHASRLARRVRLPGLRQVERPLRWRSGTARWSLRRSPVSGVRCRPARSILPFPGGL